MVQSEVLQAACRGSSNRCWVLRSETTSNDSHAVGLHHLLRMLHLDAQLLQLGKSGGVGVLRLYQQRGDVLSPVCKHAQCEGKPACAWNCERT